ncbi:hypothetical protein [Paraflavitalea sp. CAU 1676]|uniref:hypothetical protein n=1 Tax=Paraflavitalea sp. CAU 1676 TaxID=3032598 RepID=UPI0023DC31B6|nr:hypothetical protein [Paraflavitalea sp. CAU 1676]MDF2189411.1 hypothetical protein [Paraflavitalea sp. CAU 1676]
MRTSNKILLALFLSAILLFTGLFASVRIKYANGSIQQRATDQKAIDHWADVHAINGPIRAVSIQGLSDVMIVPADSARIEIAKEASSRITWNYSNGVLTLIPDTTGSNGQRLNFSMSGHVELFLPGVDSIYSDFSTIQVKNIGDSSVKPSYHFHITRSVLSVQADDRKENGIFTPYNKLRVDASNGSEIKLGQRIAINELQVGLDSSRFEEEDAPVHFGTNPRFQSDDISTLKLTGQNLRKAIITSKE